MLKKSLYGILLIYISFLIISCASIEAKAASQGDIEMIQAYLDQDGDIDAPQSWGRTLLIIAAESNQLEMISFLMDRGANPELIAKNGNTVLMTSARRGQFNVVQYLLELNVKVNGIGSHGSSALHSAASYDRPEIVRLLIEWGAHIQMYNDYGYTPLLLALEDSAERGQGISRSAELLFDAGADFDKRNKNIEDIAFKASESGNIQIMELLIRNDFDVKTKDIWRNSLLFAAVEHPHMLSYLIGKGVSVNDRNFAGNTILHEALYVGNKESLSILLNRRADPDLRNRDGKTLLIEASDLQEPDLVRLIIIAGANPHLLDNRGNNALHFAAYSGDPETVKILLIAGINPNIKNAEGLTPLSLALENEEYGEAIIELLIDSGAE